MKIKILFVLVFQCFHLLAQEIVDSSSLVKPYLQLKDGTTISTKRPMIICEEKGYYINRFTKTPSHQDLENIEGFSKESDVRWMTIQQFRRIGRTRVKGYFWAAVLSNPPVFIGLPMFSGLIKREHIRVLFSYFLQYL